MAIDKTIPNRLQADADQRLLRPEAGEMLDALNVTIAENGPNSTGVIKNTKGTIAVDPSTAADRIPDGFGENCVVVGSASDSQRGFIYWFVAHETNDDESVIYQHNPSEDTYRIVFKGSFLNFATSSFVKADVINAAFQQDGVIQTVLYFTDNLNPPRKINVDRAIAGDYDDLSNNELDYALNAIKAAPNQPVSFVFQSDRSLSVNNFDRTTHQFAMQYIYVDGEESAIGPYSKIAYPDTISASGLEEDESGLLFFTDNICEIQTNWRGFGNFGLYAVNYPDVERLRLLGRVGNNGAWFVIDEFDANEALTRNVYGSNQTIYDPDTGVYRFFNDLKQGGVSDDTVFKLYDDVPFRAEGQALVENRLMYSNYESGRPNVDVDATISLRYADEVNGNTIAISESEASTFLVPTASTPTGSDANYNVVLDFDATSFFTGGTTVVPGGSLFNLTLSFDFDFGFSTISSTQGLFVGGVTEQLTPSLTITAGTIDNQVRFNRTWSTDISYAVQESMSLSLFIDELEAFISEQLSDKEFFGNQLVTGNAANSQVKATTTSGSISSGDFLGIVGGEYKLVMGFDVESTSTDITIKPYPKSFRISTNPSVSSSEFTNNSTTAQFPSVDGSFTGQDDSDLRISNLNGNIASMEVLDVSDSSVIMKTLFAQPTFKAGCTHDLGVVYYDKFNRSGNVNRIGSFYAPTPGERTSGNRGAISARVSFSSEPPAWARKYQIVYSGMGTYSDFNSYTVGSAFPPRDTDGELQEERKQLYVSLKTIEDYREDKNGNKEYSFTEGDRLRVIKHSPTTGADVGEYQPASLLYPLSNGSADAVPIEFNVVGVVSLGQDEDNPIAGIERAMRSGQVIDFAFSNPSLLPNSGSGFISSSVTVSRGGTDVTSSVDPPSFEAIKIQNSNTVESMVVKHRGGRLRPQDVLTITFPHSGGNGTFEHTLTSASLGGISDIHTGTFVIIDAPQVTAGVAVSGTTELKYPGFDWFSVTGQSYPDGTTTSGNHLWGKHTVVEMLTPRTSNQDVYYEIGEARNCGGYKGTYLTQHGPNIVVAGDAYIRATAAAGPKYLSGSWNSELPDEWGFVTIALESHSVSDFFPSRDWSKGRPHAVLESSATVRRQNGIVYSDAYAEDVANLSLSSFNASLGNFYSLDSANGPCRYIESFRDGVLLAVQESRVAQIGVNKDIITTATQGQIPSLTSNVLGNASYYMGDFGCGDNPESVLMIDGTVFFVDRFRKKLIRLTREGLSVASENGIDSLFINELDNFVATTPTRIKIVSGYDPEEKTYYVTFRPAGNWNGFTVGYNMDSNVWQSRYSFYPDTYSYLESEMYSAVYVDPQGDDNAEIFFAHRVNDNGNNYNGFYGAATADSRVVTASNYNPSMVKVFNALSLETNSTQWDVEDVTTDLGASSRSFDLVEKEGTLYGAMGGDESANSSMHIIPLGRIESFTNGTITFTKRVNTLPLMVGAMVMRMNSGTLEQIGAADSVISFNGLQDSTTITTSGQPVVNTDEDLVLVTLQSQNGDPIRGHWAEITIVNDQNTQFELFCVNTHFSDSKQNHALGQQ